MARLLSGMIPLQAKPRGWGTSPRQHLTIGMPEGAAGGQREGIDASQQSLHGLLWTDAIGIELDHAGPNQPGMQNRHGNPFGGQIMGQ